MILKEIPTDLRNQFDDQDWFSLSINFNVKGKIEDIKLNSKDESENRFQQILPIAEKVLSNFPRLMKVNHENYHPPRIQIWIDAYCLKYPLDVEYGC